VTASTIWTAHIPPLGEAVVGIGAFDGVHLGHQALLSHAVTRASALGVPAIAVTFDTDPEHVVDPSHHVSQLLDLPSRLRLLAHCGMDHVLVIPFDSMMASMSPEAFVHDVLVPAFPPKIVVVGSDFRFGEGASGDVESLRRLGRLHSFDTDSFDIVDADGAPISSTRIRDLITAGSVRDAATLLGRPHSVHGLVVPGRGAGHLVGAPTANLVVDPISALPASGVYAANIDLGGHSHPAAVSVGTPPSFPDDQVDVEAHLIDFDGDLYGTTLDVAFVERLHGHRRFTDEASLSKAIHADIEKARDLLDF